MDERASHEADGLLGSWLEFAQIIEERPELRKLLFDSVTGLPTVPLLFPRIGALLEERGEVSLMCVNIVRYARIEEIYGFRVFDEVMRQATEALDEIAGETLRDTDVIAEIMNSGDAFVIVLSPPRMSAHVDSEAIHQLADRVEARIRAKLAERVEPALMRKFGCYVGVSTLAHEDGARLERLVHESLQRALADARARERADAAERIERLRGIIADERVTTQFQPVFEFETGGIVGYEALTRGPAGSEFEYPDKLFAVAFDADLVSQLEWVCHKRALQSAASLPEGMTLFLNLESESVNDPRLRELMNMRSIADLGVDPKAVVLELAERAAMADFAAFRSVLDYLRALGFRIAIDNAGGGYNSLQCLTSINPDWLKIDISLVRGCDTDEVRASLIMSLVAFAEKMNARLVAEGVETRAEYDKLRALGVRFGQGFLFGAPVHDFATHSTFFDTE